MHPMLAEGTLLLRRSDVERLLPLPDCIDAVESAFRLLGEGRLPAGGVFGLRADGGGLHLKAARFHSERTKACAHRE